MERQLKERLIGAAVLIAVAVLLVPEMFSGSAQRAVSTSQPAAADSSEGSSGQVKTYRLDLQAAPGEAASSQPVVEPPAPPPPAETTPTDSRSAEAISNALASNDSVTSSSAAKPLEKPAAPLPKTAEIVAARESPATADKPERPANAATAQWVVQIGSFSTEAKARDVAHQLAGDLKVAVSPVKVGNKTLYRVRSGGFAERSAAERALGHVKGQFPNASVMTR